MYRFVQLSSLEKVMLKDDLRQRQEHQRMSALRNENISYQIAYTIDLDAEEGFTYRGAIYCRVSVESPLAPYITLREVENVPVSLPCFELLEDSDFISKGPGLFPDVLRPLSKPYVGTVLHRCGSLWVTVKLDGTVQAGTYPVDIRFCDEARGLDICKHMDIEVIDACLPEQELLYTQWFHCDCIANYYQVKIFSEKHWKLIEKFMRAAADSGINLLLTPVFTPPLDTAVGGERPTVQLVDVVKDAEGYHFDFTKFRRWVALARKCGFENFEISHLFAQWGAKAAPKIIVKENGRNKKMFGWHTPATGEAYRSFLQAFLPALVQVLKEEKMEKNTYFHISDEPTEEVMEGYRAAKELVAPFLKGFPIMDALSHLSFYQKGIVDNPIPVTNFVMDFIEAEVPNLWTYYCCGTDTGLSNRYLSMHSYRNRAIGLQLYRYDMKGFLHWGFNFYNSQFSREQINPFQITDAKGAFPSGDAFMVYPGTDGPWDSLRLCVFRDALQDFRALKLLERYMGREETVRWMEETLGEAVTFRDYVHSAEKLLSLREAVNQKIKELV